MSGDINETEAAFQAYLAAKRHADRTEDVMDAIAAGVAWRRFLSLFYEDQDEQNSIDSPRRRLGRIIHGNDNGGKGSVADSLD